METTRFFGMRSLHFSDKPTFLDKKKITFFLVSRPSFCPALQKATDPAFLLLFPHLVHQDAFLGPQVVFFSVRLVQRSGLTMVYGR